jgi:hypothetical protein
MSESLQNTLEAAHRRTLAPAVILTVLAVVAALWDRDTFFQAYLMGFIFVVGIPLGSLALLMLHHLAGGAWGYGLRRILEAATRTIPLMVVFFLVLILGMNELYDAWLHPEHHAEIIALKAAYLNKGAWMARGFLCFAVWGALAFFLNSWSRLQDVTGNVALNRNLRMLSGPGVVLYVLAVTVAGWDWGMSLDPAWFSSMYGPLFMISQGLTTFGFAIIVVSRLARHEPLAGVMQRKVFHDIGNLTFAFGILWAYMTISQYLIIWAGNLPEEIPYYLNRTGTGWQLVAVALALFHFAVPFLLLLIRHNKLNAHILVRIAWWILAMRFLDLFWHVYPAFYPGALPGGLRFIVITLVVPAAMIALFLRIFLGQLKTRSLLPLHDPRFEAAPLPAGTAAEAH